MRKGICAIAATLALTAAIPLVGSAKDGDKDKAAAASTVTIQFAQPQPQTPDPAPVGAAVTHYLMPNDVTIHKGDLVTFVINGGGHGVAIHEVDRRTTRADIAENLCDGNSHETGAGNEAADRRARATVGTVDGNGVGTGCNGTTVTSVIINGVAVNVTGTNNLDYVITDAGHDGDHVVIDSGFNLPALGFNNPRLDDTSHSVRLLGTSGNSDGDTSNPAAIAGNRAGAFLTGTTNPATVGQRITVQFTKTGRFLVICMNRAHSLNDHMFGFVSVVGDDNDQ
jgi:plastocyanin